MAALPPLPEEGLGLPAASLRRCPRTARCMAPPLPPWLSPLPWFSLLQGPWGDTQTPMHHPPVTVLDTELTSPPRGDSPAFQSGCPGHQVGSQC